MCNTEFIKLCNKIMYQDTYYRTVSGYFCYLGTNLQALINFTQDPSNESSAEIVLVISNVPSAFGLTRAANAGIASEV